MTSHGNAGIATGGSKHRRQASRELVAHADLLAEHRAEASLHGSHRGAHSRGLIEEISEDQSGGSSSNSYKKDDGVPTARGSADKNSHSPDWLREKFPLYDHYSPNSRGFAIILLLLFVIFSTLFGIAYCIDQYLVPGFRILPIGVFSFHSLSLPPPRGSVGDRNSCLYILFSRTHSQTRTHSLLCLLYSHSHMLALPGVLCWLARAFTWLVTHSYACIHADMYAGGYVESMFMCTGACVKSTAKYDVFYIAGVLS